MDQAKKAYEAYFVALDGMAPAGLAVPPYRMQSWDELPAGVRAAWLAAVCVGAHTVVPADAKSSPAKKSAH